MAGEADREKVLLGSQIGTRRLRAQRTFVDDSMDAAKCDQGG